MPGSVKDIVIPQEIMAVFKAYLGTPYAELNCWEFARKMYLDGLGIDVPFAHQMAARDFLEVWYRDDKARETIPQDIPQPYDLALFEFRQHSDPHVGLIAPGGLLLHSTGTHGVHAERFERYAPHLLQLSRPRALFRGAVPSIMPSEVLQHAPEHVRVRLIRSPILSPEGHPREIHRLYEPGMSIATLIPPRHEPMIVWHNGKIIEADDYPAIIPRGGDEIMVSSFWGSAGIAISILVSIALSVAFTFVAQALAPGLHTADSDDEIERTQTFGGIQSSNVPGGVVPLIYGRHRVGLTRLAEDVDYARTFHDVGQTDTQQFAIAAADGGRTPLAPARPIGGGRSVVVARDEDGGDDDPVPTIRPRNIELTFDLTSLPVDVIRVSPGDTVEIRGPDTNRSFIVERSYMPFIGIQQVVTLQGTQGLNRLNFEPPHVMEVGEKFGIEATNAAPRLNWVGAICEGPISHIYTETLEINGQNVEAYPGVRVDTRLGTTPQERLPSTVLSLFAPSTRTTFAVGSDLLDGDPATSYTTTIPTNGFSLNLDFNSGLYRFRSSTGRFDTNRTTVRYRYKRGSGSFRPWVEVTFAGNAVVPLRSNIEKHDLALAIWTIEIEFVSAEQDNPTKAGFTPTLTSVTEIIESTETYDGTALLQIRNFKPNQLPGGRIENVTVVIDGLPVEQGSFTATPRWTANPAWICMHLLRNYMNVPVSEIDLAAFTAWAQEAGTALDTSIAVPRTNLSGSRSYFLSNARVKYDHALIIGQPQREQSVIQELITPSRVEMLLTGGKWSPRLLKDETPLQTFSSANVLNLVVTSVLDEEEISVIQIQYNDRTNNYERATLTWPAREDWPDTVNVLEMTLPGVTDPEQVRAHAQWELNKRQVPHDHIQFETTEAPRLQPYDLFWFSHEQQGWGDAGRVVESPNNSTTNVVLDHSVTYTLSEDPYQVYVRFADGTIEIRQIVTQVGDTTLAELPLTVALSQTPTADTTIWAYGEAGPPDTAVLTFRCLSVLYNEDTARYTVEALEHIAAVYDEPNPQPPDTISTLPTTSNQPPGIDQLSATVFLINVPSGQDPVVVVLTWSLDITQPTFPLLSPYDGARIFRRSIITSSGADDAAMDTAQMDTVNTTAEFGESTQYVLIGEVRDGATVFEDVSAVAGGTYQYKVVPVSTRGIEGAPAYVTIHAEGTLTPTDPAEVPGTPQNLRLEGQDVASDAFEGPDIIFVWDPPSDTNALIATRRVSTWCVEIWGTDSASNFAYRLHPRIGQPEACVIEPRFHYRQQLNTEDSIAAGFTGPQRKVTARVWARREDGIVSAAPATKTVTNVAPSMVGFFPTVLPLLNALDIAWPHYPAPRDIEQYHVQVFRGGGLVFQDFVQKTQTSITVQNMVNGEAHHVTVTPYDTFGLGLPSQTVSATPTDAASILNPGDISDILQTDQDTLIPITATEITVAEVTLPFLENEVGGVLLIGSLYVASVKQLERLVVRIREDDAFGTELARAHFQNTATDGITAPVTVHAVFVPTSDGAKTFALTVVMDIALVEPSVATSIRLSGIYLKK